MNLLDVFKDLTNGEFSQLELGGLDPADFESEPDPRNYARIISHINMGLLELYKRFLLSTQEIYIEQQDDKEEYLLDSRFAVTNTASVEPVKYILDTPSRPFKDDLLKIERVFEEGGNCLNLNDKTDPDSIYTPTYRTIQVPIPNKFNILSVQYRAGPERLKYNYGDDISEIDIPVPDSLYEALLLYVAHRAQLALGGDQGQHGMTYFQRFEMSCNEVENLGLYIQGETTNWRFDKNGWV